MDKKENMMRTLAWHCFKVAWLVLICIILSGDNEIPAGAARVLGGRAGWSLQQLNKELHDLNYLLFLSVTK